MTRGMLGVHTGVFAVGVAAWLAPALAQQPKGTLYAFHSRAIGRCPGLDWQVAIEGNDVSGLVAWNKGRNIARLEGTITPASAGQVSSFKLNAQEVGGQGRNATVQGTGGGEYIRASLEGSGTACDGKLLTIPRVAGGMGGGGG